MARKSLKVKQWKMYEKKFIKWEKLIGTKYYNRCKLCWRSKSYMRDFGICRVCFRKYAREGKIMWVRKASW
jgi:small subunit ribosomal protein S14